MVIYLSLGSNYLAWHGGGGSSGLGFPGASIIVANYFIQLPGLNSNIEPCLKEQEQ